MIISNLIIFKSFEFYHFYIQGHIRNNYIIHIFPVHDIITAL